MHIEEQNILCQRVKSEAFIVGIEFSCATYCAHKMAALYTCLTQGFLLHRLLCLKITVLHFTIILTKTVGCSNLID